MVLLPSGPPHGSEGVNLLSADWLHTNLWRAYVAAAAVDDFGDVFVEGTRPVNHS